MPFVYQLNVELEIMMNVITVLNTVLINVVC